MVKQYDEYRGMSYEQASREVERVMLRALERGGRLAEIDRLTELAVIMRAHLARSETAVMDNAPAL